MGQRGKERRGCLAPSAVPFHGVKGLLSVRIYEYIWRLSGRLRIPGFRTLYIGPQENLLKEPGTESQYISFTNDHYNCDVFLRFVRTALQVSCLTKVSKLNIRPIVAKRCNNRCRWKDKRAIIEQLRQPNLT